MKIVYLQSANGWDEYSDFVHRLVTEYEARELCDVGGGANPVLSLEYLQKHRLECTILDISKQELDKAPAGYQKLNRDIEADRFTVRNHFDFVLTKMMAEHVHNGEVFHRNVYTLLKPGGIAVHFFPTLYSLPFLANKLIPECLSSALLDVFAPRERYQLGKFPAYYSWCYGPTPRMLRMLQRVGFEILEYRGLIGHIYFNRIPIVRDIHHAFSRFLLRHPSPYFTSFAQVILRKPLVN
jgi:SAM-dependent methyltransferase